MGRGVVMLELIVALLVLVAACLLYLEWWRGGELEDLNRRVDELELARRKRAGSARPAKAATPEAPK